MASKAEMVLNTPPIAFAGYSVFGYTLPDIVSHITMGDVASGITIAYTLMLFYFRIRKEMMLFKLNREIEATKARALIEENLE